MKKGSKKIIIVLILLIILAIAGSFAYLSMVKKGCQAVTEVLFEYGRSLDADTTVDKTVPKMFQKPVKELLNDDIREELNIRSMIKKEVMEKVKEKGLNAVLTSEITDRFTDIIIDDAIKDAQFEITDVKAGFTSCTVSVRTSNVDYMQLGEEMSAAIAEDAKDPKSSLWSHVGDMAETIYKLVFGSKDEESSFTDKLAEVVSDYYYEKKEDCARKECSGEITYGIVDGKWSIKSVDSELVGTFYGVSLEDMGIDLNEMGLENVEFK